MQKAAGTEPLNQIEDKAEFGVQPTEIAHRAQNEDVGHSGIDLGAQVANLSSGRGGGKSLAEDLTQGQEIDRRMGHLAAVGDLEPPKTMQAGKLHAASQVPAGRNHTTTGVICIAESAEGLGLQLGQVGLKSEFEALLMFSEAAADVAPREMQVAAQEMDASAHLDELAPLSRGLGAVEVRECAVEILGDPLHRREAEPRRRALAVVSSGLGRPLVGDPRFGHRTEVVEDLAVQAGEHEAIRGIGSQRQTALGQPTGALVPVVGGLGAGRFQIGLRRLGILGPVEMLGAKNQIARREPVRGLPMQLAASRPEQGVVDRIANQSMREQKVVTDRADQEVLDQRRTSVVGALERVAERVEDETLTEDRGSLERLLVERIELIHPRLDQALHRTGHRGLGRAVGVAQQLLQEQRDCRPHARHTVWRTRCSPRSKPRRARSPRARAAARDRW